MSGSLVLFVGEYYKQIDGVAMGSSLGLTFANIFLSYHEQIWLKNCPCEFKPVIYKRYVDDTFLLFRSKDHIEEFRCYLNCQHPNIKFTSEIEENNSILFLDIKIKKVNNSFSTSIYRKVTFSGVFTNFESFNSLSYKLNLIFMLLFRAFKLCSNVELFHQEILNLKDIFKRNGYPYNFIDICIKRFLSNIFIDKKVYALAPKKELVCVLPFIRKKSLQLRSKLVKSVQNNSLKLFSSLHANFVHCFVLKIPLIRKFVLILLIVICVVAAVLLIMVKLTDTFLQELQNIWVFQI